jgi:hypothetical protein
MREAIARLVGGVVIAGLLATDAMAAEATLRSGARLREAATKNSAQLALVPAGTVVELLEVQGGWQQVRLPDGRTGFIWKQQLTEQPPAGGVPAPGAPLEPDAETDATPPPTPRAAAPQTAAATAPTAAAAPAADELRALRADVETLRTRVDALPAELESLRTEVRRLAGAPDGTATPPAAAGSAALPPGQSGDGVLGAAFLLLLFGAVAGWGLSRLAARRRERRQRIRI